MRDRERVREREMVRDRKGEGVGKEEGGRDGPWRVLVFVSSWGRARSREGLGGGTSARSDELNNTSFSSSSLLLFIYYCFYLCLWIILIVYWLFVNADEPQCCVNLRREMWELSTLHISSL